MGGCPGSIRGVTCCSATILTHWTGSTQFYLWLRALLTLQCRLCEYLPVLSPSINSLGILYGTWFFQECSAGLDWHYLHLGLCSQLTEAQQGHLPKGWRPQLKGTQPLWCWNIQQAKGPWVLPQECLPPISAAWALSLFPFSHISISLSLLVASIPTTQ